MENILNYWRGKNVISGYMPHEMASLTKWQISYHVYLKLISIENLAVLLLLHETINKRLLTILPIEEEEDFP